MQQVRGAVRAGGPLVPPAELRVERFSSRGQDFAILDWPLGRTALPADLTAAERAVAALLVQGLSNVAIAVRRNRSARTVANQVASIFRKAGVGARAELLARIAGAPPRVRDEVARDGGPPPPSTPGRDDAPAVWREILDGAWTVVGRAITATRRLLLARRNGPGSSGARPLRAREREVAAYAARGPSNKVIGHLLGIAPRTAASHLRSAEEKLGLASRGDLIRLLA